MSVLDFGYSEAIFNPSQKEIDKIIPKLHPNGLTTVKCLGQTVWCKGDNTLHDIGDGLVVKSGRAVTLDEARAMIFVRAHSTIPVPTVHMVFTYKGLTHIVMDRIDGVAFVRHSTTTPTAGLVSVRACSPTTSLARS